MRTFWLGALLLTACASSGGRVETILRGPSKAYTRLVVAGVSAPGALGGEDLARALTSALAGRFEAAAAADADTVMASAELGLSGASPAMLAELRRATDAEAVVFGALSADASALELSVLDARSGDVVLRVKARPSGARFSSAREAAAAGAAALAPLAKGRRGKASGPQVDELPPP